MARRDGGKAQRFCRSACRRAFDAAGRRWVADAIDGGTLTVEALRNGAAATRALVSEAVSPAPIDPARTPAPDAPAERSEDTPAQLLDELVSVLVYLPQWPAIVLPEALVDRLLAWIERK